RFQHNTFAEFLTSKHCPLAFKIDVQHRKKILTIATLQRMQDYDIGLRFNICRLSTSYVFNSTPYAFNFPSSSIQDPRNRYISSTLLHCCLYWSEHLDDNRGDTEILQELQRFLKNKFLFWVEVLSLFGDVMHDNEPMLNCAVKHLKTRNSWMSTFAQDAIIFLADFKEPIQTCTPHIYVSALPFTPSSSTVHKTFKRMFPNTAIIRTLGGNNGTSGYMDKITAVAFSTEGFIASASVDNLIRFWHAETGDAIFTASKGHTKIINSLAFSTDGRWIASGSEDATVRLWHAETTESIVFQGHAAGVTSVSFPPSGSYVMSSSRDGTLRFWDPVAEKEDRSPIKTNQGPITCATFLNEKEFVTGGEDHQGKALSIRDGTNNRQWKAHSDEVTSVALHGSKIASASRNGSIRIWSAEKQELILRPFDDHRGTVNSIAFSPDGNRMVSGSSDGTVRVWDVDEGTNDSRRRGNSVEWKMGRDGWIRGDPPRRGDHLLMWVPAQYRDRLCWGRRVAVIDGSGRPQMKLDYSQAAYGSVWDEVYDGGQGHN
ncbi:WD40-repeat-containing domain protein, partial [Mycena crocata]